MCTINGVSQFFPLILPIFLVIGWFVAPRLANSIDDKRRRKHVFARLMATRNAISHGSSELDENNLVSTKEERTEFIQTVNMIPVFFNHNHKLIDMFNQFTGVVELEDGTMSLPEYKRTELLTEILEEMAREIGVEVNISTPLNIARGQ